GKDNRSIRVPHIPFRSLCSIRARRFREFIALVDNSILRQSSTRTPSAARNPMLERKIQRPPIRTRLPAGNDLLNVHLSRSVFNFRAVSSELSKTAAALGLEKYRRHIFLCADQTEPKCAPKEKGLESWEYLKHRLKELKLAGPEPLVYRTKANC